MNRYKRLGLTLAAFAMLSGRAFAAPIAVGPGAFSGSEQVITFDTILPNEEITTQFVALGITFSGGLHGDRSLANLDDFSNPGTTIAGNFTNNGQTSFGPIEATFVSPALRVGFLGVSIGTMTVEAFRGGLSLGVFVFPTDDLPPDVFMGLQDVEGIDRIVVNSPNYPYFEMNDFQFEAVAVPEPAALTLLGLGLAQLSAARLRKARNGRPQNPRS
jgi:hypothetical protein